MPTYRVMIVSDVDRLMERSGLNRWTWPPGKSSCDFANWLLHGPAGYISTEQLAQLVDEYLDSPSGEAASHADRALNLAGLDNFHASLTDLRDVVREIRDWPNGDNVMQAVATIATSQKPPRAIAHLPLDVLGQTWDALERITTVVGPIDLPADLDQYKPGNDETSDRLVFDQVRCLDDSLDGDIPCSGCEEYSGAEVVCVVRLVRKVHWRPAITKAILNAKIGPSLQPLSSQGSSI